MIKGSSTGFSKPIVRLAVASVGLGLAVMLITISILFGFRNEIRNKVIGFDNDLQIVPYDNNYSFEANPVDVHQDFYPALNDYPGVEYIQPYAQKAGLIKTESQIQGVLLKGVGAHYNLDFLQKNLVSGKIPVFNDSIRSSEILISDKLAKKLHFKVGSDLRIYFVSKDRDIPIGRKLKVAGIYDSGLGDLDQLYIIGDIKQVQKLNRWNESQVAGFEIKLDKSEDMERIKQELYYNMPYDLYLQTIVQKYPSVFQWLKLLDTNVYVILVLMIIIGIITMISTLLVIILERTFMIGVLRTLGAKRKSIQRVFVYNAIFIIGRGMLWGNVIGLAVIILQNVFGIIHLDPNVYFVSTVPMSLKWMYFILINVGTFLICSFFMLFPTYLVSKINISKAIRFK
ncbi:MAG: ABC transporter permease [Bacteroidales bacterium]